MKCLNCNSDMKKIMAKVENAKNKALSYQCGECGYFDFEKKSINKIINEIKLKEKLDINNEIQNKTFLFEKT